MQKVKLNFFQNRLFRKKVRVTRRQEQRIKTGRTQEEGPSKKTTRTKRKSAELIFGNLAFENDKNENEEVEEDIGSSWAIKRETQ